MYLEKEPTILVPSKTQFTVLATLEDVDFIYDMGHRYGEPDSYKFIINPIDFDDYRKIEDMVTEAEQFIYREAGPYSKKNARGAVFNKYGYIEFNQLFAPKVSGENIEHHNLFQRTARIRGHLREDPTGLIYAQCDYCDVQPLPEEQCLGPASGHCDLDDF